MGYGFGHVDSFVYIGIPLDQPKKVRDDHDDGPCHDVQASSSTVH